MHLWRDSRRRNGWTIIIHRGMAYAKMFYGGDGAVFRGVGSPSTRVLFFFISLFLELDHRRAI